MPHHPQLHQDLSEGRESSSPIQQDNISLGELPLSLLQHLNPAKAIGEIKKLLTGISEKPAPQKAGSIQG